MPLLQQDTGIDAGRRFHERCHLTPRLFRGRQGKAAGVTKGSAEAANHAASENARWLLAVRPKTLGLSAVPVLAGSWIAAQSGAFRPDVLAAALLSAGAIQVATNLWNDAADGSRGTDGPDRLGPPRVTALGLLKARQVRTGALLACGLAVLAGLYLALIGGWPIVVLGIVSLATGFLYSMGPYPLSGSPLGEGLVILFFGIAAVCGTGYLHGMLPDGRAVLLGLIIGLPAAAVLLVNNHRDRVQDARAGRRTLAILIGEQASRGVYALLLLTALALSLALARTCTAGPVALAPAALLAAILIRAMTRLPVSARLNRLIAGTSAFQALILAALVVSAALCGDGGSLP